MLIVVFLLKKSNWFPLTFDHPNNADFPAAPRNINKQGYHDAFHLQTKWKGKKHERLITGLAFQSGTGTSVALSLSTVNNDLHWDLVPKRGKDLKWYIDPDINEQDRLKKGFTWLIGVCTTAAVDAILEVVSP